MTLPAFGPIIGRGNTASPPSLKLNAPAALVSRIARRVRRKAWARSATLLALAVVLLSPACQRKESPTPPAAVDPHLQTNGTVEVTAKLVEIPDGAIFKRELYDYATVLKYQVLKVHRGKVAGDIIYVGQYNPFKPRAEAADARAPQVGGNVKEFRPGQVQHLALDTPMEDKFMGGIVNKYFGKTTDPIYWAVWTDLERP